jgi:hypothetical protein
MSTRETPEMQVCFLAPDVAMMHSRFHIYGDTEESVRNRYRYPRGTQTGWEVAHRRGAEHRRARRPASKRQPGVLTQVLILFEITIALGCGGRRMTRICYPR